MRARGALASVARSPIVAAQSVGQEIASQTMSGRTIELDDRIYAYLLAEGAAGAPAGAQMANILERIDGLLAEAGTDKSKLLSATPASAQ